jgi:hypothetical protein
MALGLQDAVRGNPSALADTAVAGADEGFRVGVERTRAGGQFAGEKGVEGLEIGSSWYFDSLQSTPARPPTIAICAFLTGARRMCMKAYTRRPSKWCGSRYCRPA